MLNNLRNNKVGCIFTVLLKQRSSLTQGIKKPPKRGRGNSSTYESEL